MVRSAALVNYIDTIFHLSQYFTSFLQVSLLALVIKNNQNNINNSAIFTMDDGIRHRRPEGERVENSVPHRVKRFDSNKYNTRKTLAKGLLDVALLTNNISNLKQLLKHQGSDNQHPFFEYVVGGLLFSICLQV